jgi:hypothetical protein
LTVTPISLDDRVVTSVEWATRAVRAVGANPERWTSNDDEIIQPFEKMLMESALLALIAHRALGENPAIFVLLDSIAARHQELDRIYELVRWRPHLWTSVGAVWVILDKFSLGDSAKRERLRTLWEEEETLQPLERVPYRLLDQAWVRTIARDRPDPLLASVGIRSCTSFGNIAGAVFMHTNDLYALAHTPMYVTDFGLLGRTGVEPGWVGSLGLSRLLLNDLDLSGELAISDLLTQQQPDIGTLVIVATLNTIVDSLGFIPSPTFRDEAYQRAEIREEYVTFHSYHSTYVYGLLCSVIKMIGTQSDELQAITAGGQSTFPSEWNGRRLGFVELSRQVTHTLQAWHSIVAERGVELDSDRLLRSVLDAYLLHAAAEERIEELLSLLGMGSVAGSSPAERAVRKLLATRALLSGDTRLTDRLMRHE